MREAYMRGWADGFGDGLLLGSKSLSMGGEGGDGEDWQQYPALLLQPLALRWSCPPIILQSQPLAPRKRPRQLERGFCPKCFKIAECHAVGNGRKRCVLCSKTYKAGAVPSRVPACPLCDGYSVVFNGESLCTSCNKGFSAVML